MTGESPTPNPDNARDGLVEVAELLLCPFCGGEGLMERVEDPNVHRVYCNSCQAGPHPSSRKDLAIAAWNTRHRLDATRLAASDADREGVRGALANLLDFIGDKDMRVYASDLVVREAHAALASATTPTPPGDDALRAALEPFARYADAILKRRDGAEDQPVPADRLVFGIDGQHVTIGDLRRVRAALANRSAEV